jgi:hypothetical protein
MADVATGVGLPHTTHATRARAIGIHRMYLVGKRGLVLIIGHFALHPIFLIPDWGPHKAMLVLLWPPRWMPARCFASAHPVQTQRYERLRIWRRSASSSNGARSKIGHPANTKSPTWPMPGIHFDTTLRYELMWIPRDAMHTRSGIQACRQGREQKAVLTHGGGPGNKVAQNIKT